MVYPGGKNGAGVYQAIINQVPPHSVYIEPFLGSGAIMRHIRRADLAIGVDRAREAGQFIAHVKHARFVHGCGIEFLERRTWRGGEFVYADPPYVTSTRVRQDLYDYELTDADHERLLRALIRVPAWVMISGYPSALYDRYLSAWRYVEIQVQTRGGPRTERLWMNYPEPAALHDTSYVGDDYRERERIRKKARRWVRMLEAMPAREQQAIFSAMRDAERAWPGVTRGILPPSASVTDSAA